ncbi:MAG: HAMP domain-containing protein [Phycisphaerales bacterium]|nr:MAG: HAMP domain-containing protein [Phycisphaerales bacterium]
MTLRAKLALLLVAFTFFVVGSVGSVAWAIWLYVDASFNQFAYSSGLIDRVDLLGTELAVDLRYPESAIPTGPLLTDDAWKRIDAIISELHTFARAGGDSPVDGLLELRDDLRWCDRLLLRRENLPNLAMLPQRHVAVAEWMVAGVWNTLFARRLVQYALDRVGRAIPEINRALSRHGRTAAASADRVQRNVLIILTANLVAAVVLAAIAIAMVQRWIARPIVDLRTASERFGEGDLAHRCPVRSRDELGKLATQVNEMAHRLSESQRQLVERERMAAVGELCSAVAHGIRNPLSAIASSAELSLQQGAIDEVTRARLNDVLAESERLDQRVSRLLEFARTRRIATQVLLVDELLEQAADEMAPHLERKGIRLARHLAAPGLRVRGDREMIINAVIELISNAADQTSARPEIELRSGRRDRCATISVRDHGPGFRQRSLQNVFDLFFTTKVNGTGIGLASVRKTAQMHDGDIRIENAADGGAVVTLEIPELVRANGRADA